MLTVLSPAKTLDYDTPPKISEVTQPVFLDRASKLVEDLCKLDLAGIQALMGCSESIAVLNRERFKRWHPEFSLENAKQAILAFKGSVYAGLNAETLDDKALSFSQKHMCILSGLYGVLRPLDLMQPYRLEMGLKFTNSGGNTLYEFWGENITLVINDALKKSGSPVLVNLASNEYFKSVKTKRLDGEVITPVFKDLKQGKYKVISFFAKKARGVMARYILTRELNAPDELKAFSEEGYYFSPEQSGSREWVFLRDAPVGSSR